VPSRTSNYYPRGTPQIVTISAGQYLNVTIGYDSGIR
jgi:hypothetical protein